MKIDINYPALGRTSLVLGMISMLIIFLGWDSASFELLLTMGILLLLSGVDMIAWCCWRWDNIRHDDEERSKKMRMPK